MASPLEFSQAEAYCAELEIGGHLDWRMPNRAELISIHDFTTVDPAQDPAVFDTIPANQFGAYLWTTTPRLTFAIRVQTVGQRYGFVASALVEGDLRHVRCVREVAVTPAPEARFGVTEFTVYDQVSGLTWERAPDPVTVIGSEAAATCSARQTGGLDQWRVPSLRELLSITNPVYYQPALNPEFLPPHDERFWEHGPVRREPGSRLRDELQQRELVAGGGGGQSLQGSLRARRLIVPLAGFP